MLIGPTTFMPLRCRGFDGLGQLLRYPDGSARIYCDTPPPRRTSAPCYSTALATTPRWRPPKNWRRPFSDSSKASTPPPPDHSTCRLDELDSRIARTERLQVRLGGTADAARARQRSSPGASGGTRWNWNERAHDPPLTKGAASHRADLPQAAQPVRPRLRSHRLAYICSSTIALFVRRSSWLVSLASGLPASCARRSDLGTMGWPSVL